MVISQYNDEVKTELSYMTSINTSRWSSDEMQGTSMTRSNTLVTKEFPLMNSMVNQNDEILTGTQIQEYEKKDMMSTKVIDETTLIIYFRKHPKADPFARSKSFTASSAPENSDMATELKVKDEAIHTQGYSFY